MKPEIALRLYRMIDNGPAIGVDSEGNLCREETKLATAMAMLDVSTYIPFSHTDKDNKKVFDVKGQVAFLREWADALEQLGPNRGN